MLNKIERTIKKYNLLREKDKILIAVSGGADSLALLHCLYCLREKYSLELMVAHLNHMFRGEEAEKDAEYVKKISNGLGLEAIIGKIDVPKIIKTNKLSPQDAARSVRYDFLQKTMLKYGFNKIALGHHMDDQAETVLLHLLKGAGLDGLQAMVPQRDFYIRPLLEIKKSELEKYCEENELIVCQDISNLKDIYLRNKIRNKLFPWLASEINPNIVETLANTADILREENKFLDEYSQQLEGSLRISIDEVNKIGLWNASNFAGLPVVLQRRFIRRAYKLTHGSTNDLSFSHVEAVRSLILNNISGTHVMFPGETIAAYAYHELVIMQKSDYAKVPAKNFYYETTIPGRVEIPEIGAVIEVQLLGEEQIYNTDADEKCTALVNVNPKDTLIVRNRKSGDIFKPSGMGGSKKLKDYFIDEKIKKEQREQIPIILSKNTGKIVWIAGMRVSDEFKYREIGKVLLKYSRK